MSAQAMNWVFESSPYSGELRIIHLVIADIANDLHDNRFRLGEEALAAKAHCSTRTVERAKARFVKDGYLEVVDSRHGPGKTNECRFMMPSQQEITGDNLAGEHPTIETEHPTNVTSSLYINSRERKLTQNLTQLNTERGNSDNSITPPE